MTFRQRLVVAIDRLLAVVIALYLGGTVVLFGGRIWWAPPLLAFGAVTVVGLSLIRVLLEGRLRVLKSPLMLLGVLMLGLAVGQIAPLPGKIAESLAPASRSIYLWGFLPSKVKALDASVPLPDPLSIRSPVSVDRPATLRWLAAATACLGIFWGVSRFTDRLSHLYIVWGTVVAAFFLNTAVACVQLTCGAGGVFGFIKPGSAPFWGPSLVDLTAGPGSSVLRTVGVPPRVWAFPVPERVFEVGTQMGGAGAYLALGSIALPLALALTLQFMAPRGSREPLSARLRESGRGSLVLLLALMLVASAALVGLLAGPWFSLPFGIALALVGIPSARGTGLLWGALGMTALTLVSLTSGAATGFFWAQSTTFPPPIVAEDARAAMRVWKDSLPILQDFPVLGTGLGTFAVIFGDYKTGDAAPTTALSSLLKWWVESGIVGLGLLALAGIWCLIRVPGALGRVGTADRALAFGLIGAAVGFTLFSTVHWTVELISVALSASAVAGGLNRWLAGGTDLFVERG